MPKVQTLEEAFIEEVRDIYDAEKQLVRALPKMAKGSSSPELRDAFREHLEVTKGQVVRLEQIFEAMGQKARSKPCKGMKGLLEEGTEIMEEEMEETIGDLALIGAAQKAEHYEISGYGTLRTFAQAMGQKEVAQLLDQTLKEEEATDKKLTMIAKTLYKEAQKTERAGSMGSGTGGGRGAAKSSSSRSSRGGQRSGAMEEMEEEVEA